MDCGMKPDYKQMYEDLLALLYELPQWEFYIENYRPENDYYEEIIALEKWYEKMKWFINIDQKT